MADPNQTAVLPPPEATDKPALPKRVGKYEVVAVLGSGAMGVVYKCRQPDLGRFVAVKVLGGMSAGDDDLRQRFLREARAAAQLRHPNTVRIYDVGVDGAHPYLVLEWIDGRPLDQLIGDPVLTVDGSLQVAFHVASALHDAHEHGVIHRDVKPSNILIDEGGRPKLADFGLAKFADGGRSLSLVGDLIGTPKYMSPDQVLLPSEEVDARTDVFSLGSVLYEMLTGKTPFNGATPLAVLRELTDEDPTPPHELKMEIPEEVSAICMKALAKDRDKRYATAEEFANAIQTHVLHRWFGSPEVELLAGLPPLATGRPVRSRWRWWQWGGLIAAGVFAGWGLSQLLPSTPSASGIPPVMKGDQAVAPIIDFVKLVAKGEAELVALPMIADPNVYRPRLEAILDDLATAAKQRPQDSVIAVLRSKLLRRAGDFSGALEALSNVAEQAPEAAAERMMSRFQWHTLLLGSFEDPLLRPKPPEALKADAKAAETLDDAWKHAAGLVLAASFGDAAALKKALDAAVPTTANKNLASDLVMLRADALFRSMDAEAAVEAYADNKKTRDAAQRQREALARQAPQMVLRGLDADPNHFGLLFLKANSFHRRAVWMYGDNDTREALLRRNRSPFDTAFARLRVSTPLRGADHAVARMVLLVNFGRYDYAQDQLADAMSMRSGDPTNPMVVYASWLKMKNPPDGQVSVGDAEAMLRDIAHAFDSPPEGPPAYYVRALANSAAGKWEDARSDVQRLAKMVGSPNSVGAEWRLWLQHAPGSTLQFLHAHLEVLSQEPIPTPVELRINLANEVVKRASDPDAVRREGAPPATVKAVKAWTHFRLATLYAEKSDRDSVLKHVRAALAEKVDDLHAAKCREERFLRYYNDDPEFVRVYMEFPPP
jgi:tetratricopeptide (TPR) repeat protein/predicted Ser/Thr protein kinase